MTKTKNGVRLISEREHRDIIRKIEKEKFISTRLKFKWDECGNPQVEPSVCFLSLKT
jgi:hypothetical protein